MLLPLPAGAGCSRLLLLLLVLLVLVGNFFSCSTSLILSSAFPLPIITEHPRARRAGRAHNFLARGVPCHFSFAQRSPSGAYTRHTDRLKEVTIARKSIFLLLKHWFQPAIARSYVRHASARYPAVCMCKRVDDVCAKKVKPFAIRRLCQYRLNMVVQDIGLELGFTLFKRCTIYSV